MKDRLLLTAGTTYRVRTLDGREHIAEWNDQRCEFHRVFEKGQRGPAVLPMVLIGAVACIGRGRPRWYPLDNCYRAAVVARTPTPRSTP